MKNEIKKIIEIPNGYESNNRIYSGGGISATISARDYKDAKKILVRVYDKPKR